MDQMASLFVLSNSLVSLQACINPFLYGSLNRSLALIARSTNVATKSFLVSKNSMGIKRKMVVEVEVESELLKGSRSDTVVTLLS